jgi:hypothetical protein
MFYFDLFQWIIGTFFILFFIILNYAAFFKLKLYYELLVVQVSHSFDYV